MGVRLEEIEVESFRIWRRAKAAFPAPVSVLVGPNGSGKTSLLEAAWYAASLRSHRGAPDAALVRHGDEQAVVRATVGREDRSVRVDLEVRTGGRARARLGGSPVPRRREVLGVLRAQIFAPERTALIRGEPSARRDFADELLVQLHPRFHGVIRDYDKALRQRNALLRDAREGALDEESLAVWDDALVASGAELSAGRADALSRLAPQARAAYESVAGDALSVAYGPKVPDPGSGAPVEAWADSMRARMAERRDLERIRGVSLVGPHRDDVAVEIGGLPARTHASQGEAWLGAVSIVLGAHRAVAEALGEEPVLLLDDPFAPLDPSRRQRVASALPGGAQIVATAADPAEVPPALGAEHIDVERCGDR